MLGDGRFWMGVIVGVAGVWAYKRFTASRAGSASA